jgi:hypothetical protein
MEFPMQSRPLSLLGAAVTGFLIAGVCFNVWAPRPASAQFKGQPTLGQPLGGLSSTMAQLPQAVGPQPIEIQALDRDHFVVATREPRLVMDLRREGTAQNMLVTVVSHYTVREDRLVPVEHVRVPEGYRLVTLGD